ncbi:phospholipase ABHD3-like [Ornithodoros turicata]|uniref:phospholipase ABHD3-like n=1 Tax=Ornithodoros turicata TaxID=34597 RepID=UPI003138E5E8
MSHYSIVASVVGTAFALYYVVTSSKKPCLVCGEGTFRNFLLTRCSFIRERFLPTPWCFTSHAQTLVALLLQKKKPDIAYNRQLLTLSDGGVCALDWFGEENAQPDRPTVLVLPGLTADSQVYYIKSLVPLIGDLGCRCVVLNHRGDGGVPLKTLRLRSCLNTDDIFDVLAAVKTKYPSTSVLSVAYSFGGVVLTHYLSQTGVEALIDAALVISTPTDLLAATENLQRVGPNLMINHYLTKYLVDCVQRNRDVIEAKLNVNTLSKCKTVKQFDACFTAPLLGFGSVEDYYKASCLNGKLGTVRRPLLFLTARDDIFVPKDSMPLDEIKESGFVAAVLIPRGGHIGFVDGLLFPSPPFYSERFAARYVDSWLQYGAEEFRGFAE